MSFVCSLCFFLTCSVRVASLSFCQSQQQSPAASRQEIQALKWKKKKKKGETYWKVYTDAFFCDFNNQLARYVQTSAEIRESVKKKKKNHDMLWYKQTFNRHLTANEADWDQLLPEGSIENKHSHFP